MYVGPPEALYGFTMEMDDATTFFELQSPLKLKLKLVSNKIPLFNVPAAVSRPFSKFNRISNRKRDQTKESLNPTSTNGIYTELMQLT